MTDRIAYKKLPGFASAPFRRRSLYAGPDHVLSVRSSAYMEEYRRFYFRDIQAIVLSEGGSGWSYYLLASAAFLFLMFLLLGYSWHLIFSGLCGAGALCAFVIGVRLPNCACYLKTATTTEPLPSLGRLRAARRTLAILRPLIETAQETPH